MSAKKLASQEELLSSISVILVQTRSAGNIGAAARAMKNMGLSRLKLVGPCDIEDPQCRMMAGSAFDIVEKARCYSDWSAATADESILAATTSARGRRLDRELLTPRNAAALILEHARKGRVGLVFGPERSGLTDSQLAACDLLVSFPAHPGHPVLNLAQTVLLMAYEIYAADLPEADRPGAAAQHGEREEMFGQMEEVLIKIGFLSAGNPSHIMDALRTALAGPDLSPRAVRIFRGLFSHIEWYVREGYKLGPDKVKKP